MGDDGGTSYIYYDYKENVTEEICTNYTSSHFFPSDVYSQYDHDYSISPDRCSSPISIAVNTEWTQYEVVLDIPSIDGKIIGNAGNDYLAIQIWTYFNDGECLMADGFGVAPPNERTNYPPPSTQCVTGTNCESCRNRFYNPFSYEGVLSLASFQLEKGIVSNEYHKIPYQETLEKCRLYYESSDCNSISVTDPFDSVTGSFGDTVRFQTNKHSPCQVSVGILEDVQLQSDGSSTEVVDIVIDSNKIDNSSFVIEAGCSGRGSCVLKFDYEADADIYRLEETVPEPI
jgi:hypothetical protein